MAGYWTTATGPLARWMNDTPKVVLSNTLDDASSTWPNSSVARGDGAAAVEELKRLPDSAIVVFGGVQTVRSLVGAGVVDEFWLKVNPVAIGRGGPIFADLDDPTKLELLSARSFPRDRRSRLPKADSPTRRRQKRSAPMVIVAGHITVEPQQRESYLAGCVRLVERARGKAGCLDFAITADLVDPGRINIFERWESRAAVESARGSGPGNKQVAAMLSASVADYDVADVRPFLEKGTG